MIGMDPDDLMVAVRESESEPRCQSRTSDCTPDNPRWTLVVSCLCNGPGKVRSVALCTHCAATAIFHADSMAVNCAGCGVPVTVYAAFARTGM